jgi:hypothetical protein
MVRNEAVCNHEYPIVFPTNLIHKHVAGCHRIGRLVVVAAGFVYPPDDANPDWQAFGESESLKMKCREEDSAIINRHFNA